MSQPPKGEKVVALRTEATPQFKRDRGYDADVSAITFDSWAPKAKDGTPAMQGADLSAKPKIIFLAGRGKTGKTTAARWMTERALAAERKLTMGDVDPSNTGFSSYFDGVEVPENRDSPESAFTFVSDITEWAIENRQTVVIDLGGGDTTLRRLADELPDLTKVAEDAGVAVVVMYFIGPQVDDLSPIASMTQRGFYPNATAIVMNEASVKPGDTREQAFAPIGRHPVLLGAFEHGGVPVWMPRLLTADVIELKRARFLAARDGVAGKDGKPILGSFDRSRTRAWLAAMDAQFAGISTWLP